MRITVIYENDELVAMEKMATEINRHSGIEEKVKILRDRINVFSPYINAGVVPYDDGSTALIVDVSVDYIRDISGTIQTNAATIVSTGKRVYEAFKALSAISPVIGDLKSIMKKSLDFKVGDFKKAA